MQIQECPCCGGEGEVGTGRMSHTVNSATIDPPWEIVVKCDECNSKGWVVGCSTPLTLDDIEYIEFEMAEAGAL